MGFRSYLTWLDSNMRRMGGYYHTELMLLCLTTYVFEKTCFAYFCKLTDNTLIRHRLMKVFNT